MNKDMKIKKIIFNNFFMLKLIWEIKPFYILITIVLSLFTVIFPVFSNILIKRALDITQTENGLKAFIVFLCVYAAMSILNSVLNSYYSSIYNPARKQELNKELYSLIFKKSLEIDSKYFDDATFLNKYSFLLNNILDSGLSTLNSFSLLLSNIFGISLLIILITSIDNLIVIVAFIIAFINFFINIKLSKLSYEFTKENTNNNRKIAYVVRVFLLRDYTKELKTTNIHKALFKLYDTAVVSMKQLIFKFGKFQFILSVAQMIFQILFLMFTFIYLVKKLMNGLITPGGFAAVFNSFNQLSSSIEASMKIFPEFYKSSLYIEDFRIFLSTETRKREEGISINDFESLEFRNVYFKYSSSKEYILENVSFKLNKRESIAIVGSNGSGKTTITNLIMGLYEPAKGEVLLNGLPISVYKRNDLNQVIGIMLQKFCMYALPIKENIMMDKIEDIENNRLLKIPNVLKMVGIKDKIDSLKYKLDTNISFELKTDGTEFSGGELQKIALARTIEKDYKLLILDEPSSALDAYSEKNIFDNIFYLYKNKSLIIISHRLSNIKNVNRIFFVKNGKISEAGSHEELMKLKGEYYELYTLQSKNY